MNKGFWYAVGAYFTWGLFPIYWKALQRVPALQLLGHRIVWSFLFLILLVILLRQGKTFRAEIASPRILLLYGVAAVFLAVNWLTYVWAVNAGYIVETSLGYFINPLLSMLLFLPAALYLLYAGSAGEGEFLRTGALPDLLMIGAGVVTAVPLLMFAAASQRISLFQIGVLQYIAPTMYFLIGVLIYGEPLTAERLTGFVIIWMALILFAVEGYLSRRNQVAVIEPG